MKTYVLYHANCADGFGAALAYHLFRGDAETIYLPCAYEKPLPEIEDGCAVWLLDFSAPRAVLDALAARSHCLAVIDHHASAEADLRGVPYLLFNSQKSGAVLAWEFFRNDECQVVPALFAYIQDRDLWQWKLPESREISAALSTYRKDFQDWRFIMNRMQSVEGFERIAAIGRTALRVIEQQAELAARNVWWAEIGGYAVPVTNCTAFVSEVCHRMLQEHPDAPFVAAYRDGEGTRTWSLRSRADFACNAVAEKFGGGGHPQACGFSEELHTVIGCFEQGGCIAITKERARQQIEKGYTAAEDDAHAGCELIDAAVAYAHLAFDRQVTGGSGDGDAFLVGSCWPWEIDEFKPAKDARGNLVRAGALIAAEIDRLDRVDKLAAKNAGNAKEGE